VAKRGRYSRQVRTQLHRGLGPAIGLVLLSTTVAGVEAPAAGTTAATEMTSYAAPAALRIKVLSNRPDLISAGNALVEVVLPAGADPAKVQVTVGSRNVTASFAERADGRYLGLVRKLAIGKNTLTARAPGFGQGTLVITNHPNGGPLFTGPQLKPWTCQHGAVDKQCNQPPKFTYQYMSSNPLVEGLQPYNPASPPGDVATTTTDQGVTVPFIVRVETGYQDRDQYRIAVLYDAAKQWKPWRPQRQWNHKVLVTHGGGCGAHYGPSAAPVGDYSGGFVGIPVVQSIMGESSNLALGRGFAVMSTSLNNNGHNCNVALQAESMMMAKERIVEAYGEIRYTIGTGCSGGSITQQTVANAYPGIYQGLIVTCSYPDTLSPGMEFADYHKLRQFFENPGEWESGTAWSPAQWAAVEGHVLPLNAITADEGLYKGAFNPIGDCGVAAAKRYDPKTNPGGVRCSVMDSLTNLFGRRAKSTWSPMEERAGHGFGGVPLDNIGVQYGLDALRSGAITPEMFVDLNAKVGSDDIDMHPVAQRRAADRPALANAYRSGMIDSANNLDSVAIIDHKGPDPGLAHDSRWPWAMRERLDRAQGHHRNQVIWYGLFPLIGDPGYPSQALLAMDRWLTAVEADNRNVAVADKITQDRPGDIKDRCTQAAGLSSPDGISLPVLGPLLNQLFGPVLGPILEAVHTGTAPVLDPALGLVVDPVLGAVCGAGLVGDALKANFGTPRTVADQPNTADVLKCQLKPLNRNDDYGPFGFTDAQWTQLRSVFPNGVCDYTKPGVSQQPTVPWLSYGSASGVVTGGTPLPAAPANVAPGWAGPAFRIR